MTPRRSAGLMAAASATVSAAALIVPKKPQPDVDELMSQYAAQNNNNPGALVRSDPSVRGSQCAPGHAAGSSQLAAARACRKRGTCARARPIGIPAARRRGPAALRVPLRCRGLPAPGHVHAARPNWRTGGALWRECAPARLEQAVPGSRRRADAAGWLRGAQMHLLKVLEARKGKNEANVSLRHSVKIDTTMKAPVHHRRNIEFTFVSPLLLFELLSLLFWLVGLAGVADWQARNTKAMAVVSPNYQPPVAVGNLTATPLTLLHLKRDTYAPSYEWFIVWSSFFSACYMLYVTVCRSSLWQHACAMWFSSITTATSITHCFYISQLVSLTRELVTSKEALKAVEALYAGLIGWTLMNLLALAWMCSDIDHDIALDAATKKLEVQQEVARSRSNSRAPSRAMTMTPLPVFLSPVSLSPRVPPPRVVSTDGLDVDRVLDEVLDDGSLAARSGLGRGSGAAFGSTLARAEEGRE